MHFRHGSELSSTRLAADLSRQCSEIMRCAMQSELERETPEAQCTSTSEHHMQGHETSMYSMYRL